MGTTFGLELLGEHGSGAEEPTAGDRGDGESEHTALIVGTATTPSSSEKAASESPSDSPSVPFTGSVGSGKDERLDVESPSQACDGVFAASTVEDASQVLLKECSAIPSSGT